jgi:outer membrane biogenesis lipoprotein LolB
MRRLFIFLILASLLLNACASSQAHRAEIRRQKKIQLQALKHYRMGIDDYVNTKYAEAISNWKQTLDLDPNYPNAKEYILRAETAQKSINSIK